jgi:penicillin-binding protein 1A
VTPIELAGAYGAFFSGGRKIQPHLVTAIGDQAEPAAEPAQALRPETAYVLVSMMKSVVEEGTARAASTRLRRPVAGKTGTSNDQKDAWFVGATPDLLAAVWVGFDDMKKLGRGEAGGKTALPIWTEFMAKALANRPVRDFAQPPGVEIKRIDATTGLLAAPGTEGIEEVFLPGTAPQEAAPAQGEAASADKLLLEH